MSGDDYTQGEDMGLGILWVSVYVVAAFCLLILTIYTGTVPILATGFYIAAGLGALIGMALRR